MRSRIICSRSSPNLPWSHPRAGTSEPYTKRRPGSSKPCAHCDQTKCRGQCAGYRNEFDVAKRSDVESREQNCTLFSRQACSNHQDEVCPLVAVVVLSGAEFLTPWVTPLGRKAICIRSTRTRWLPLFSADCSGTHCFGNVLVPTPWAMTGMHWHQQAACCDA